MGQVIQEKKGSKRVAIIVCWCVILLTMLNVFNESSSIALASGVFQTESSEGIYYGVESYEGSSKGSFYFFCGDKYTGSWESGEFSGVGEYTYTKIGTYVGEFVNGKREGTGSFEWLDGSFYSGKWENDKINGELFFASFIIKSQEISESCNKLMIFCLF